MTKEQIEFIGDKTNVYRFAERARNERLWEYNAQVISPQIDNFESISNSCIESINNFKKSFGDIPKQFKDLTIEQMRDLVISVYSKIDPSLAEQITNLMSNPKYKFDLNLSNQTSGRCGEVRQSYNSPTIVSVSASNDLHGIIVMAHEFAHLLVAHKQNGPHGNNELREVESLVLENMALEELKNSGIISELEALQFVADSYSDIMTDISFIMTDNKFFGQVQAPFDANGSINVAPLVAYMNEPNADFNMLDRVMDILKDDRTSSHILRYVVGRVVADNFINLYRQDKQTCVEKYKEYISTCKKFSSLEEMTQKLLGKSLTETINDFVNNNSLSQSINSREIK